MTRLPVYILAGGKSSRFGSDKARAMRDGRTLIQRLADQSRPIASSITVVADAPDKYADLNLHTIADAQPGLGPIGGLATSLDHAGRHANDHNQLLLLACDLLEFDVDWLTLLKTHANADHRAAAFHDRFWQPFPAIYSTSLADLVRHHIRQDIRSMQALLTAADAYAADLPDNWPATPQANTPADLRSATD